MNLELQNKALRTPIEMNVTSFYVDHERYTVDEAWVHLEEKALENPGTYLFSEYEEINDCLTLDANPTEAWERMYNAAMKDKSTSTADEIRDFITALYYAEMDGVNL